MSSVIIRLNRIKKELNVHVLRQSVYVFSQTCLKGSPREDKNELLKDNRPLNTCASSFALYFGSGDPEKQWLFTL